MLTEFGKELRRIRLDSGELLKEMSDKLNVTSSYLSAIEHGKREIPLDLVDKISKIYKFDDCQYRKLCKAADESALSIKLDLKGQTSEVSTLANAFARKFKDLDQSEISEIMKIINKERR